MSYTITLQNYIKIESYEKYFDNILRDESHITKFFGNGIFFTPFNKTNSDYDREGISTAKVSFHLESSDEKSYFEQNNNEKWDLEIILQKIYGSKIEELSINVICDKTLFEKLEKYSNQKNQIKISFNVIKWEDHKSKNDDESYQHVIAKIDSFSILAQDIKKTYTLSDYEVKDIENYLIRKNCLNTSYGQVAEICKEFADSFRHLPFAVDKDKILEKINSLIAAYRSTFHLHLHDDDAEKINYYKDKYNLKLEPYATNYFDEFKKITDKKEFNNAIAISNHLWSWKKPENFFQNNYPISLDETSFLADEYINIKHVRSQTCERILFNVLISSSISEYVYSAQINQCISPQILRSVQYGFYKQDAANSETKSFSGIVFKIFLNSTSHIVGRIISGLISWIISGLIAGNNETARIVLFGTMFAADTVLMGLYSKHLLESDKNNNSKKEEHYFNIIKNMCTLHAYSFVMDVKIIRNMINELSSSGVNFQIQIFQLLLMIEQKEQKEIAMK